MSVKVINLPTPVTTRALNFTTQQEATMMANTFLGDVLNDAIVVQEMAPEAVNPNSDGRKWYQIQFSKVMNLTAPSTGRKMNFTVPFDLNAGTLLDDEVNNPKESWVFLAEPGDGDTFTGDVERSDGQQ